MPIPHVDSSTTLANLENDLVNTQLNLAQRDQAVEDHLDAFIGHVDEREIIARGRRLFDRAVQLPSHCNPMRTALARTVLLDLSKRCPKMASAAAVAIQMDTEHRTATNLTAVFNHLVAMAGYEDVNQTQVFQQLSRDAITAVCITEFMAFHYAENVSAEVLTALLREIGPEGFRLALQPVTEREASTPERLEALAAFYKTAAGKAFCGETERAIKAVLARVEEELNARMDLLDDA